VCCGGGVGLLLWWVCCCCGFVVIVVEQVCRYPGDVAQMVERSLSMREVQGSIPCFSTDHVTVIKSVGISTFPNVHFAVLCESRRP
jgi:hypothetical protein